MPLLTIVIVLVIIGVIMWLVNVHIPMDATIKKVLNIVVLIAVVLWVLQVFGVLSSMNTITVG